MARVMRSRGVARAVAGHGQRLHEEYEVGEGQRIVTEFIGGE